MNVLVTGGAGFIGANFIHFAMSDAAYGKIVCLDKLTYASCYGNISEFEGNGRFFFENADICDRTAVYRIFEKYDFDAVINFAAESHVDNSIDNPEIFLKTNIIGTSVLLDAVNKYKVKRFHQISTDEVYGDLPLEHPHLKFTEETPLHPSSPYSSSKASADMLCLAYFRTYGTPVTVSRCSNNYGMFQHNEKLIPKVITNALRDEKIPVYGDGLNVRDWICVQDHCKAIDAVLKRGKTGNIYNVGADCELSNIEIIKTVLDLLDKPQSLITYVADRKGHDRRYAVCADKIKNELGWTAATDFCDGIKRTVEMYKSVLSAK